MKDRIGYYDVARGLGIIFVVIGHIDTFYMPFRQYVISFHMALFLIISGMLMAETGEADKNYRKVVWKKCKRIMVPYFLFSFLSIGIEAARILINNMFSWPHLRSLFLTTLTMQGISVMWFLPTLFLSELLFLAIRKLAVLLCSPGKRAIAADVLTVVSVAILVVCIIWCNFLEQVSYAGRTDHEIYERLHEVLLWLIRSAFSTVFVCVGYFVRKYMIPLKIPAYLYCLTGVLLLLVSAGMCSINPGVDLRSLEWGETGIWVWNFYFTIFVKAAVYLFGAVTGAMGTIFVCKAWDKYSQHFVLQVLAFLGGNSLIIMATHLDFHVLHFSMELADILNRYMKSSVLYHVCVLIFVFTAEFVLSRVINRFIPVLAGKLKKG